MPRTVSAGAAEQLVADRGCARVRRPRSRLRGTDLEGATQLWFDHPGLSAVHVKDLTFRISAGPDCAAWGTTTCARLEPTASAIRGTIVVGDRPESIEVEPNNTPEKAGAIVVNSVMQR